MKHFMLIAFFCILSLSSCKNNQEGSDRSAVDRHNERVAQEAVQAIKTPLDQAKAAAEKGDLRNKQMEDQLKTQ